MTEWLPPPFAPAPAGTLLRSAFLGSICPRCALEGAGSCEESRATCRVEDSSKPLRWISADALVLELRSTNIYLKEGTEVTKQFQARCEVVPTFCSGDEPAKIWSWGAIKVSVTDCQ